MKKILSLFFVAFALVGLWGCDDDDEADIQGVVDDYIYIVDGTEADYQSTSCSVFHTPDLEDGTVEMDITIALTRSQSTTSTFNIELDNTAVTSNYEEFPDGVLQYSSSATIAAGETSTVITVTIAQSDFPKLVEPQYMAVFRVTSVTGDLKISSNSNAAILYVITETIDPAENIINVEESVTSYTAKHYSDGDTGDSISQTVSITGTDEAYKAFDITLAVDNSLVDAYNEANGTSYIALTNTDLVNITTATMEEGGTSTTATVSISDDDRDAYLTDDAGYLIPVIVSDAGTATIADGCGVTYLIVNVQNFDTSMDFFSALYLGDYRMATWYQFSNAIDFTVDDGYTYVFHVFIDEVTAHSRIGDFADINENWINMLRFGQLGNYDTRLEWFVGPNGCRKNLYTSALEAQTWYQIALVYDSENHEYRLYVEGELQDSETLTEAEITTMSSLVSPSFQAIEFNSSWGENYREGNEFHGRLWEMSIFNWALPASWITNYVYHGMNASLLRYASYYGLCAYWKFDEGIGSICAESTGLYEDIDFTNTIRCDDESSMVAADVSEYVQWIADQYNDFDE